MEPAVDEMDFEEDLEEEFEFGDGPRPIRVRPIGRFRDPRTQQNILFLNSVMDELDEMENQEDYSNQFLRQRLEYDINRTQSFGDMEGGYYSEEDEFDSEGEEEYYSDEESEEINVGEGIELAESDLTANLNEQL